MLVIFWAVSLLSPTDARTWTSLDGRTLEGDLVKVDGEVAVVKIGSKEVRIPFAKLSEEDVFFLKEQAEKAAAGGDPGTLFGVELLPGKTIKAEGDLDEKTAKALSGNALKPLKVKIKVQLPADFDPDKPQKVYWTVGGINDEGERLRGNIGVFGNGAMAAKKGWVVISADTEHGNPRESTVKICKGDDDFHFFVIDEMVKIWPDFKGWQHACGGYSSGAKASFFRIAQLLKADVNVIGGFFSGCNGAYATMASEETKVRKGAWRRVKGFQSTGDSDTLVTPHYIESVSKGMKVGGMKKIVSKIFKGGHSMNSEHLGVALDWFLEE